MYSASSEYTYVVAKYWCLIKHGVNYIAVHNIVQPNTAPYARAQNNHHVFLDNTRNVGPDNLHGRQIFFSNIQNAPLRNIFVSFGNKEAWWKVAHPRRVDDLQLLSDNVAITRRRLQVHCTLLLGIVLCAAGNCSALHSPLFLLCRRRAKMNKLLLLSSTIVSRWAVSCTGSVETKG